MADVARKFDDVLRNLAGQAGSLESLLGVFFSFLHKNTDFYVTFDPDKTAKADMGFPTGKAEQMLLRAFRSLPYKPYGSVGGGSGGGGSGGTRKGRRPGEGERGSTSTAVPATTKIVSSKSSALGEKKVPSPVVGAGTVLRADTGVSAGPAPATVVSPTPTAPTGYSVAPSSSVAPLPTPSAARSTEPATAGGIRVRYTEDGKQIPIGNGGVTPKYYWTQTVKEATVYVDVPPGTRSKDVSCVIQPRRLRLEVRGVGKAVAAAAAAAAVTAASGGAPGQAGVAATAAEGREGHKREDDGDLIFDGELPSTVSREDSMWSLNDGKTVVISFEKTTKSWWKSVVEGDPEIDTSQVTFVFGSSREEIRPVGGKYVDNLFKNFCIFAPLFFPTFIYSVGASLAGCCSAVGSCVHPIESAVKSASWSCDQFRDVVRRLASMHTLWG